MPIVNWRRVLALVLWIGLAACQPQVEIVRIESTLVADVREVTREVLITPEGAGPATPGTPRPTATAAVEVVNPPAVGSEERPVRLLFRASIPAQVVEQRGEPLVDTLEEATGLHFRTEQPAGYRALVDVLCGAPQETVAFVPPLVYVLAEEQCDAQVSNSAVRLDLARQMGMIVVRSDSGINNLEELDGRTWAVPAEDSLTRDLYVQAMLAEAGVEPAEVLTFESDNSALLAVFSGEADFASATFMPPVLPYEERPWVYGEDDPELWRSLGVRPTRHPIGYIVVLGDPENGGYRVRDARAGLFDVEPNIFSETRIISVTRPFPNDSVVFGAEFPLALARQMTGLLNEFAASELCRQSLCSSDFLGWEGLEPVDAAAYDPLRFMIEMLAWPEDRLWSAAANE